MKLTTEDRRVLSLLVKGPQTHMSVRLHLQKFAEPGEIIEVGNTQDLIKSLQSRALLKPYFKPGRTIFTGYNGPLRYCITEPGVAALKARK
jgi:hypothetical protein